MNVNAATIEMAPSVSSAIGEAWANEVASTLRAQTRNVVGAWPGTLREARSRVLIGLRTVRPSEFESGVLESMSRAVNDAARRRWDEIAEPDPEP